MSAKKVFISHSGKDDGVVAEIRQALESLGLGVWADSRQLTGGEELRPEILKAIDDARHLVAVLSLNAVNSRWVAKEIQYAMKVKKKRTDGFKVIPILLDGIEPGRLASLVPGRTRRGHGSLWPRRDQRRAARAAGRIRRATPDRLRRRPRSEKPPRSRT